MENKGLLVSMFLVIVYYLCIYFFICQQFSDIWIVYVYQARPLFKDKRKFSQIADPVLQGQYPIRGLYQALAVAAMCVQEQPNMRPVIADVVTALSYLASQKFDPERQPLQSSRWSPPTPPRTKRDGDGRKDCVVG